MEYGYHEYGKKNNTKKVLVIIGCLLVVFVLFGFLLKNNGNVIIRKISNVIIAPFEFVSIHVSDFFSGFTEQFKTVNQVNKENEQLKDKVRELEFQKTENLRILDENSSLKKMLDIKKEYQNLTLSFARILYRNPDNFAKTFTIDLGAKDGIKQNQAVIHQQGLVGYISQVYDYYSVVTTILDPNSSVSVTIATINEPAIVKGDLTLKGSNELKLEYIPPQSAVSIGDMVYTSGLGNRYPSNIPVGKVENIINEKNEIDRYATIRSCVNLFQITEIAIVGDSQ